MNLVGRSCFPVSSISFMLFHFRSYLSSEDSPHSPSNGHLLVLVTQFGVYAVWPTLSELSRPAPPPCHGFHHPTLFTWVLTATVHLAISLQLRHRDLTRNHLAISLQLSTGTWHGKSRPTDFLVCLCSVWTDFMNSLRSPHKGHLKLNLVSSPHPHPFILNKLRFTLASLLYTLDSQKQCALASRSSDRPSECPWFIPWLWALSRIFSSKTSHPHSGATVSSDTDTVSSTDDRDL